MSILKLKDVGGAAAGILLMLAVFAIPIMFLIGAAEFSVWVLDWIPSTIGIATLACVVFLPLTIIPPTRGFAGNLYALASLVFGACLWLYALAVTYMEWGMLAVIIGVMVFGVGVVFTGTLAANHFSNMGRSRQPRDSLCSFHRHPPLGWLDGALGRPASSASRNA